MIAAREARLDVEDLAVIDDGANELVHVVRLARRLGEQIEERLVAAIDGIGHRQVGRELVAVRREVREVLLHGVDARLRRSRTRRRRRRSPRSGPSSRRAPARRSPARSPPSRAPGPPSASEPMFFTIGHEVGEARDVRGAGRAGADHRRDLRDDAAHVHLLAEQVPRAGEERDHVGVARARDRCARRPSRRTTRSASARAAPSGGGA